MPSAGPGACHPHLEARDLHNRALTWRSGAKQIWPTFSTCDTYVCLWCRFVLAREVINSSSCVSKCITNALPLYGSRVQGTGTELETLASVPSDKTEWWYWCAHVVRDRIARSGSFLISAQQSHYAGRNTGEENRRFECGKTPLRLPETLHGKKP
ncbi:hypothetical protein RRG08_019103 [Elysia crispata]|uniref:Uncharacterized protein n=1 Tax=Elysia crispata TaxID=231223 RepID=A0AAE1A545_9GAST|nr:hypothetical protein RRG08_019103 [Elysia crispata]